MRYDHLNPQYQCLIDKIEGQEKRIKDLQSQLKESNRAFKKLVDTLGIYCDGFKKFNKLPWYKKMFFKFKL